MLISDGGEERGGLSVAKVLLFLRIDDKKQIKSRICPSAVYRGDTSNRYSRKDVWKCLSKEEY